MHRSLEVYKGHGRDVLSIAWHPHHAELFASGGDDGQILYWLTDYPTPQARVEDAHDKGVTGIAWHPVGHLLASGSIDCSVKVWSRCRPGDLWRDRNYRDQELQQSPQQLNSQGRETNAGEGETKQEGGQFAIPGLDTPMQEEQKAIRQPPPMHPPAGTPPGLNQGEMVGQKRQRDYMPGPRRGWRRGWQHRRGHF
eukprot:TRINITY_DN40986_c0_g1_i5.p3 TRINITY_DN40986_c0_g1~~TRINITY_DN40986_c0_g1_i5.p3  ORF type:complete len:196 (-),score=14.92 TRINITY_DN40986_c0_g1_i5:325-912(-)